MAPFDGRFRTLGKAVTGFFVLVIMLSVSGAGRAEAPMFPDIRRIVDERQDRRCRYQRGPATLHRNR